ncbi:MAG: hypothetical protein IPL36_07620 [Nigerium sp.]|nr:hypothetical protein [Nigerium sp.]
MSLVSPSREGDLDAWALTGLISPRAVVRVAAVDAEGRPLNSYPGLRPLRGPRPVTPWAVPLADAEGRFLLLCADLDAKGSPQDAEADARRMSALLDEVGLPHVVCESGPTGGRHVWLALREPVDAVLVGALAHLLKAWLPTLDVSPLVNPTSGCVRPPGATHRAGGTSRVLAGSVSSLTHPTVTADQVGDLVARLVNRVPAPPPVDRTLRRPVAAADGMPFLAGPKRPLSAACRAALETAPSGDLSRMLWRVLCGVAVARWRFDDVAAIADAPGLEHARSLRTGATRSPRPATGPASPAAVLRRQWTRAVDTVAHLATDPHRADDESFDVRAETVAELVRSVQGRADATAGRWGSSRAGLAQRRVLDALGLYHLQAVRPIDVEADIRRLALTCGLDRETARRALLALAADGWIARTRPSVGRHGARWTIDPGGAIHTRISSMLSQAVPRPAGTGTALRAVLVNDLIRRVTTSAHDAFAPRGGLGSEASSIYARLQVPTDTLAASRLTGWTMVKTARVLERLAALGLVSCRARRWQQSHVDRLDALAVELGTAGRGDRRAALYAEERASWAWWQAELAWMRAPRPAPPEARRPNPPGRLHEGDRWPPHPRHGNGRADFARARRVIEAGVRDAGPGRNRWAVTEGASSSGPTLVAVHSAIRRMNGSLKTYGGGVQPPRDRITPSRRRSAPRLSAPLFH